MEQLSLTENARTIAIRTHGRYLIDLRHGARATLVGFHGYQENAAIHLDVLRRIAPDSLNLVSIQALNRFYTRANKVVAGWMTSEDRELAMADNIAYVAAVLAEVTVNRPLIYCGFSQGVAMAYRAAAFVPRTCDGVLALAGDVPPDVVPVAASLPPVLIGRGTEDAWYSVDKMAADVRTLRDAGVTVAEHVFTGGHVWDDTFVARARAFVAERIATTAPAGGE